MIDLTQPIDVAQMSLAERIALVEALWNKIAEDSGVVPPTAAQQAELDRRLEAYRKDPERGSTWDEVRQRLDGA